MLYEYVLLPSIFNRLTMEENPGWDVIIEELLWGMRENGLLASPGKEMWQSAIQLRLDQLSTLKPSSRERILALIRQLADRKHLIRHPRSRGTPLDSDQAWLDMVCQLHQRAKFTAVFCSGTETLPLTVDKNEFVSIQRAPVSPRWKKRKNSLIVDQCEEDFVRALTPLLRYAGSLDLVDPYFSPTEEKYIKTLKLCADLLGKRPETSADLPADYPFKGAITIHTSDPELMEGPAYQKLDVRKREWGTLFPTIFNGRGMEKLNVLFWGRHQDRYGSLNGRKMHDRYIFTDQCGVQVPGGLDCPGGPHCRSTEWCLLDWEDYNTRRLDYPRDVTTESAGLPFKLRDRVDYPLAER